MKNKEEESKKALQIYTREKGDDSEGEKQTNMNEK